MSYGNLRARPDLTSLFGPLRQDEHDRIMDELLRIDDRLKALAQEAGQHIGIPYRHSGLGFFGDEIAGGPFGEAGDIWFEIEMAFDESHRTRCAPPWIVDSRITVFCADVDPLTSGCTHDLMRMVAEASTPSLAIQTLAAHVNTLATEVCHRQPAVFTGSLHADLAARRRAG